MSYEEKAFEIIKDSIKSAIFIDEKAKEFYNLSNINEGIEEEKLSVELFESFKKEGVSLAIHKFIESDISDSNIKKYLFKGRDLILLDWELDGNGGEEYSLKLLSEIINSSHINFCCVYTRTPRFDDIFSQIETYFSGLDRKDYEKISNIYGFLAEKEIINKIHDFLFTKNATAIESLLEELGIDLTIHPEFIKNDSISSNNLLKLIYYSLLKNIKSTQVEFTLNSTNSDSNSLIINNTIILILKKDDENDPKPSFLFKKIAAELVRNKNSFIQLLGLEMQTIFNSNESFIDENIIKSSTEALFKHRNYLFDKEKEDKTFSIIIKKLLLEHATLKLRTAQLSLLDSNFLVEHSKTIIGKPDSEELHNLNTFYNSVIVKSLNNIDFPNLNFGDIFKDTEDNYYLCITALCDCYYPNKIDHNFYFVKGKAFENIDQALKLGDTAFLSFLPNKIAVYWGEIEIVKKDKIKKLDSETYEEFTIRQRDVELIAYKDFLYKPFYVRPKVYNVEDNKLTNNKIRIWDITNRNTKNGLEQNLNYFDVEYVTTLRNDYTQRIANHAFGHPARVGVDFVKK